MGIVAIAISTPRASESLKGKVRERIYAECPARTPEAAPARNLNWREQTRRDATAAGTGLSSGTEQASKASILACVRLVTSTRQAVYLDYGFTRRATSQRGHHVHSSSHDNQDDNNDEQSLPKRTENRYLRESLLVFKPQRRHQSNLPKTTAMVPEQPQNTADKNSARSRRHVSSGLSSRQAGRRTGNSNGCSCALQIVLPKRDRTSKEIR
jgi:hypothetical protein